MNIEYCISNDSCGLLDASRSVSAVHHHNGMNVDLLVIDGDIFGAPVNAFPPAPALPEPANISPITQQDTLVLQVIDLDFELRLRAQSVAEKSLGQYKTETFLLPQAEWARLSSDSAKVVALQCRMRHLDRVERDLDLRQSLRQPAGIIDLLQAVQPAERDLDRTRRQPAGIMDLPQAVQPAERDLDRAQRQPAGIMDLPQAVQPAERDLDGAPARRQPAGIIDLPQAKQPAEGQPEAAASGKEPAVGAPAPVRFAKIEYTGTARWESPKDACNCTWQP